MTRMIELRKRYVKEHYKDDSLIHLRCCSYETYKDVLLFCFRYDHKGIGINSAFYNTLVAVGAAESGHIDIVGRMLKKGVNGYADIVSAAYKYSTSGTQSCTRRLWLQEISGGYIR